MFFPPFADNLTSYITMPISYNRNNPDSLEILLQKANAIKVVNNENLTYIQSRKGEQVITQHRYECGYGHKHNLETNPSTTNSTKININGDNESLTFEHNTSEKNIDDIVASWRYRGESLTTEHIAFDDFMDLKLNRFDDLLRLQEAYDKLLDKYSRVLSDEEESRAAVEVVLRNMEVLQVAIGEIHLQTIDVIDTNQMNDAMATFMERLSYELDVLKSKVPGIKISYDLQGEVSEDEEADIEKEKLGEIEFDDCKALQSMHTLSEHNGIIYALEPYVIDDKQYLASASHDRTIKLWDLSNNTVIATLEGHDGPIWALTLFEYNGVYMLASGSTDSDIKIWDLSTNTIVRTLSGHSDSIVSLALLKKDDKTILISGSDDKTIKLWDVDDGDVIATLEGHEHFVASVCVYNDNENGRSYLASSSFDHTIKIWSLDKDDDYSIVKTIDEELDVVHSLRVVDYDNKKLLLSGDENGCIKLWCLESHSCVQTIKARRYIPHLEVLHNEGSMCLACPGDKETLKIWDVKSSTVVTTLKTYSYVRRTKVFMNGDRACLAGGDRYGNIILWM